jgi:hypothetical protein
MVVGRERSFGEFTGKPNILRNIVTVTSGIKKENIGKIYTFNFTDNLFTDNLIII